MDALTAFLTENIWPIIFVISLIKYKQFTFAAILIIVQMVYGTQVWLYILISILVLVFGIFEERKKPSVNVHISDNKKATVENEPDDPDYM